MERGDARVVTTAGELGYAMDVDGTVAAVLGRGRQANPVAAFADHLRAFRKPTVIVPRESVEAAAVEQWVGGIAVELAAEPREAAVRFDGALVQEIPPRAGATIDEDELAEEVRAAALAGGGTINAPIDPVEPKTTQQDLDEAAETARLALSSDVIFERGGQTAVLTPTELGGVLRMAQVGEGDDLRLELQVRQRLLTEALGTATIDALEQEPESAEIDLEGGAPRVRPGRAGFTYDEKLAAKRLLETVAERGDRRLPLPGRVVQPELTTKEARQLQVVEKVSSFTTEHACCESRVTNIHRIADLLDEHLILPGETLSVNDLVGERTEEKGFVGGGAIFEGEFVEQIGGGVSQFATTMFNAAWFGGYDIPDSKRHSYYISRYPVGREATLNYPNVDLKVTNNSPYGLLVDTSYTDTSITVTFWGKKWVEVKSSTGDRTNIKSPTVEYRENDELEKGASEVIQEAGAEGFDITVTRTMTFPDGRTDSEALFTRYLPQNRIVERNT